MENEETLVQDSNFVRREYYVEPPAKGATVEAWQAWLKADRQAAINAKRAYTKSQRHQELPESLQARSMTKRNGVWSQSAMVGFVSDGTDSSRVEAAVDAGQEREIILGRQQAEQGKRSSKSRGRAARQRQAKRAGKARRFGN